MGDIRILRREAPEPVQEIVHKLRELLARAETGELRELLVYYTDSDSVSWDAIIGDIRTCVSVLHLDVLPYMVDMHNDDGLDH